MPSKSNGSLNSPKGRDSVRMATPGVSSNSPAAKIPPAALAQASDAGATLRNSGVTAAAPAEPSASARQAAPEPSKPPSLDAATAGNIENAKAAPSPPSQTEAAYRQAAEAAKPAQEKGVTMDH